MATARAGAPGAARSSVPAPERRLFGTDGVRGPVGRLVAAAPDGRNINDGCGSTHVEALAERTATGGFDAGFAFDGDADRVLAADRRGEIVDGDELLALAALHLRVQ